MRIAISSRLTRFIAFLCLFLLGCGPDFDPPSELHSLRVLAVEKDVPYAQPGQTVNLQILWQDASPLAGKDRPIALAWSPPCFDPPGDLFYACFSDPDFLSPDKWRGSFDGTGKQAGNEAERTSFEVPL